MQRFSLSLLLSLNLSASVILDTSINDLYHRGDNELTGSIGWSVIGDEFRDASPATPIILRVSPGDNSYLSSTLVDQTSLDPVINQPINLAMIVDDQVFGTMMVANPDAVRIARWVAGETEIWIEVRQSSDEWLSQDGNLLGPSPDLEVFWEIGLTARRTDQNNDANLDCCNLPFNTRNPLAQEGDFEDAVSTNICLDLRNSTLLPDALLMVDHAAFSHQVQTSAGVFDPSAGTLLSIDFTNDFTIARGWPRSCSAENLVAERKILGNGPQDLATVTFDLDFGVGCNFSANFLDTTWNNESFVTISITTPGAGFRREDMARFTNPWWLGLNFVDPMSAIQVGDQTLYQKMVLVYQGEFQFLFSRTFSLEMTIDFEANPAEEITIHVESTAKTHSGPFDTAPYDGEDQLRRCSSSEFVVQTGSFTVDTTPDTPCNPQWPMPYDVCDLILVALSSPVVQTGQTISLAAGDDGDLRKGIAPTLPRFNDNGDGTITDHRTGLIWTRKASCYPNNDWGLAFFNSFNLRNGECELADGSFITDWRIPTVRELRSLLNYGFSDPALSNSDGLLPWSQSDPFEDVQSLPYWSSTTDPNNDRQALAVSMLDGSIISISKDEIIPYWAVRGPENCLPGAVAETGQTISYIGDNDNGKLRTGERFPVPRFLDNNDGTVLDKASGLTWMKHNECTGAMTWADALTIAATTADGTCNLSDGSQPGDWRLPNISELFSLTDLGYTPAVSNAFGNGPWITGDPFTGILAAEYWSSTTLPGGTVDKLTLNLVNGEVLISNDSESRQVWLVR